MSLRLKLQLIISAVLLAVFALLLVQHIQSTRSGVHEEVVAANAVALQLLSRVDSVYEQDRLRALTGFLTRVGRIRANEIELFDAEDRLLYRSPPARYKAGRDAPAWYTALVSPAVQTQQLPLAGGGRLVLRADPTRATLDGWDELVPMLWALFGGFAAGNALVFIALTRALGPLAQVVQALGLMQRGQFQTRLPPLSGREAGLLGRAFNQMAQSVQDSLQARREARLAEDALAQNRQLTQIIQQRIEQERGAIARELHDEMGQQVTAIKTIGVSIAQRVARIDPEIEASARLVAQCADEIYDGVHRLIARLHPLALDQFGLHDALSDLLADWRQRCPEMSFTLQADAPLGELDDLHAASVYRIVQEAVSNAVRHAQADRIEVRLAACGRDLDLQVRDNGRGLGPDHAAPGHYGVQGMRERAQSLGGRFAIGAGEAGGTAVSVHLPQAFGSTAATAG
jgi:two-component system, NarL family, sensor histidine kinase UhpB